MRRIDVVRGLLVAIAGLAGIEKTGQRVGARQEATDLSGHPLVGSWVGMTPGGPVPNVFHPDGSFVAAFPSNAIDPGLGLVFQGPGVGRWEAVGERGSHFTAIQTLTAPDGTFLGTFQFEGHPEVSEDGQTFIDETPQRVVTRDAQNVVTFDQVLPVNPPVRGYRITPDGVDLPVTGQAAASPTP
jgi:hypothetical protein